MRTPRGICSKGLQAAGGAAESAEDLLGRFVGELHADDISGAALEAFDRLVLDFIAVVLAGLRDDDCVRAAWAFGGIGMAMPGGISSNAFALGTCAHWFDWDDTDDDSHMHGGAVIFPTLLSLWRSPVVDGKHRNPREFVAATVAAYEVACCVGGHVRRHGHRGWMPTGSGGSIAAAGAAARLMGAGAAGVLSAMGIAAAGAGISRQALADQVNAKGTLAGMAARNAADAALLWAAGVAGPNRFLDGDYGLCALQAGGKHGSGQMTIEPGHFRIEKVSTKPYPSCRSSHAVVDAVMCLRARSEEIAHRVMAVSVTAPPGVVERCGKPFVAGDNPRLAAQFSIPYAAAVALRDGRPTLADFRPERVAENAIRLAPLMNAVRVTRSAERDDVLTPVHVVFEGDTGTIAEEHVRVLRGDPCLPSSHAEQRAKLQDAASGFLSSSEIEHTEEIARGVRRAGPDRLIRWLEELAARRAPHP